MFRFRLKRFARFLTSRKGVVLTISIVFTVLQAHRYLLGSCNKDCEANVEVIGDFFEVDLAQERSPHRILLNPHVDIHALVKNQVSGASTAGLSRPPVESATATRPDDVHSNQASESTAVTDKKLHSSLLAKDLGEKQTGEQRLPLGLPLRNRSASSGTTPKTMISSISVEDQFLAPRETSSYRLAVGISVAVRNPPTIFSLLDDIFHNEDDLEETVVVVHLSYNVSRDEGILRALRAPKRKKLHVILEKEPYFQADPTNIPDTRGDSMERTVWRTKQVMDYAMLLKAVLGFNATYNLILEDDAKPARKAFTKIRKLATRFDDEKNFGLLALYSPSRNSYLESFTRMRFPGFGTGAVAWMYSRPAAERVVEMLLDKPWWYPVDLLIPPFLLDKMKMTFYVRTPHLFQHASEHSTYIGEDASQRKAETWRSPAFELDDENSTSALTPSKANGYIGCFQDRLSVHERDLVCQFDFGSRGTIEKCRQFCQKSFYFGLQGGGECFCGNEFGQYGPLAEDRCNISCRMAGHQQCGGQAANSVFRVRVYRATFQGCYNGQILSQNGVSVVQKVSTSNVDICVSSCGSNTLFALSNGNMCQCMKLDNADTTALNFEKLKVDDQNCNVRCSGYRGQVCGGSSGTVAIYRSW